MTQWREGLGQPHIWMRFRGGKFKTKCLPKQVIYVEMSHTPFNKWCIVFGTVISFSNHQEVIGVPFNSAASWLIVQLDNFYAHKGQIFKSVKAKMRVIGGTKSFTGTFTHCLLWTSIMIILFGFLGKFVSLRLWFNWGCPTLIYRYSKVNIKFSGCLHALQ